MFNHQRTAILAGVGVLFVIMACSLMPRFSEAAPPAAVTIVEIPISPTPAVTYVIVTSTPEPTATATLTPLPQTDEEVWKSIQRSINLYARGYNENNFDYVKQAVDPDNKEFLRLVKMRFDNYQASILSEEVANELRVKAIKRKENGYTEAHIFSRTNVTTADWTFRLYDGEWVLTEPLIEEIGEPVMTENELFTFMSYPYADDVNQKIMILMVKAAERVRSKLGTIPDQKALVHIRPIYSLDGYMQAGAVAWYSYDGSLANDEINIYTPNSYPFGFYSEGQGWEQALEDILTHEYTHMVHHRCFGNVGRLLDWYSEGLAEFVAGYPFNGLGELAKNDLLIPIVDEERYYDKQDLAHIYTLHKDMNLAYIEANSLITYIYENYGGMTAVWDFGRAYDREQDINDALWVSLGVTYPDFNKMWREWLIWNH